MISPTWDSEFANSRVHGRIAQHELLREVLRDVKQRRTAVDVGAHIGLWTKELSVRFQRVLAFEPVVENFKCLQANVPEKNVALVNAALGAEMQTCDLRLPPKNNSGCWYVTPGDKTRMETLDAYDLRDVDLIKIDVEGYEGAVIRGAYETIRASRPVIVFEDNETGPRYFGAEWDDPKLILASLGYTKRLRWRKDESWTC